MGSEEKPFFISPNPGFIESDDTAEFLHPEHAARVVDESATETQYFGFSVPEARIHALCYLWHHPKLKVASGGLMVWQGIKRVAQHSELFDYRNYMGDGFLANDLHEYRMPHGYGVKVITPQKHLYITYENADTDCAVELDAKAVQPVVMFADGNHFEQTMRMTGRLRLRGTEYTVDCYNIRDRSWGKPRQERNLKLPPMSWATAVFNDDYAVTFCVMDQASGNPELRGTHYEIPEQATLNGSWLYRDGKLGRLVSAKKRIARHTEHFLPLHAWFEGEDEFGRKVAMRGELIASNGASPIWPNSYQHHPLMRWESDGMVTHGDCQEAMWNDYMLDRLAGRVI